MQKTSSKEGIWFEHMPKEKLTYDLPPCQSFAVDNTIILSARGKCSKPTPHCSSTETHTLGCVVFSVECFWGTCPQEEGVTVNQDHRAARPVTQLLALMAGPFTPAAQSHGNVLSDLQCLLILPLPRVRYPTSTECKLLSPHTQTITTGFSKEMLTVETFWNVQISIYLIIYTPITEDKNMLTCCNICFMMATPSLFLKK